MLGIVFVYRNDLRNAWRFFAQAARLEDPWPESQIMLAQITARDHDFEEALGWLQKGLDRLQTPEQKLAVLGWPAFSTFKRFESFRKMEAAARQQQLGLFTRPRAPATKRDLFFKVTNNAKNGLPAELDLRLQLN